MVFTLSPSAHLGSLATGHGFGTIPRSSGIARFVQGGVVKTVRCRAWSRNTPNLVSRNYDVLLNMNLKKEIDRHFAPILQEAGFERFDGPWLSYRKALPDIHYHVDVENHYYANSFSVTLQTVDRNGNRHTLDLADFNDSHDFKYPGNSTVTEDNTSNVANADETRAVLLVAFELLKTHGISWLLAISPA